tara:strand:+ start:321 stop:776 length:456 start_codon:yes stop_codon:yes gene_type:complete
MATTVSASNLSIKVKEDITLNGVKYAYESEQTISSINMISQRIVRVPTSVKTVLSFGTVIGAGTFHNSDVKYIRVTNLDDTNYITLGLMDTDADTAYLKIGKGESMVFYNTSVEVATNGAAWASWSDFDTINAQANSAAVDIEIFVASSQS